jgi:hypothetical protein
MRFVGKEILAEDRRGAGGVLLGTAAAKDMVVATTEHLKVGDRVDGASARVRSGIWLMRRHVVCSASDMKEWVRSETSLVGPTGTQKRGDKGQCNGERSCHSSDTGLLPVHFAKNGLGDEFFRAKIRAS